MSRPERYAVEPAGYLSEERGRAVAPAALRVETSALFRMRAGTRIKEAVAGAALPLLGEAETVLVDDSTSVLPLPTRLGRDATRPVAVVTDYLEAVRRAAPYPLLGVHLLGGSTHRTSMRRSAPPRSTPSAAGRSTSRSPAPPPSATDAATTPSSSRRRSSEPRSTRRVARSCCSTTPRPLVPGPT